jgi:hypothetical protein
VRLPISPRPHQASVGAAYSRDAAKGKTLRIFA